MVRVFFWHVFDRNGSFDESQIFWGEEPGFSPLWVNLRAGRAGNRPYPFWTLRMGRATVEMEKMGFLKIFQLFVVLAKLWKILKKWVLLSFG
jgi:hypothetical protein